MYYILGIAIPIIGVIKVTSSIFIAIKIKDWKRVLYHILFYPLWIFFFLITLWGGTTDISDAKLFYEYYQEGKYYLSNNGEFVEVNAYKYYTIYTIQIIAIVCFAALFITNICLYFKNRKKNKQTLYVSDLDGTLLRSDETLSDYTCDTVNKLVKQGMLFSYATARSYTTAKKVTEGLDANIPIITYNGTFIINNTTGKVILANYFAEDIHSVIDDLIDNDICPIVYGYIDDIEKFSYIKEQVSEGTKKFLKTRGNDKRENPVAQQEELHKGEIFHITCIDEEEKLRPLYEKYKDEYYCTFYRDMYTQEQWLEIMPPNVSKANAIKQLKEYLECDKVVVFGDQMNDIDMFKIADESYAVENAVDELKGIATDVIEGNDNDGVAKWLESHFN